VTLTEAVKADVCGHAAAEYPKEACGLVIIKRGRQVYFPCRNLAVGTDQFAIDPEDYAKADQAGEIVAVVHSHPNLPAEPSQADLVSCEASGLPWFILSYPVGTWSETYPQGYKAPLVGRQWSHGVLDCYSIIRDWYDQERGITLPDFERHDEWWLRGHNLYEENFEKAGFREIDGVNLMTGDVILMQVGSPVSNHGAVYLGDGLILHHVQGRLSTRDVYGGYWLKNTTKHLRYENSSTAG
jgi:proteasome lid subunit RPN8/RPN11